MTLGRAAALNSIYMLIGNGGQMVASLGVFLYLARVLSPADFGAMGVAAAIVDLLTVFGRFGQVEALLQKGADDQGVRSTSFWLLMAVGIANLIIIIALAKPLALMTATTLVAPVMLLLAAVPLIQNLGQINEAMLRYEMRYRGIAVRNVGATLCGAAVAALLATKGFGVFALAAQKLVFTIIYSLTVLIARPWLPSRQYVKTEGRRLITTGFDVTINNTLQMANGRIVDLSIGFFLGVVALGQTRVAWRLYDFSLQLIIAPLSSVSYSLFARVRDNRQATRNVYLRYTELICLIAAPLFLGVSLISGDVIVLLAGNQWRSSASVLAFLSLSIIASCFSLIFTPVMVAARRTAVIRRQAMLQAIANVVLTIFAAQISVTAVVITYILRMYFFALQNIWIVNKMLDISARTFARRLAPILSGCMGLAVCAILVREATASAQVLIRISAVVVSGAIGYVMVIGAGDRLGLWRGYLGELMTSVNALKGTRQGEPAP